MAQPPPFSSEGQLKDTDHLIVCLPHLGLSVKTFLDLCRKRPPSLRKFWEANHLFILDPNALEDRIAD